MKRISLIIISLATLIVSCNKSTDNSIGNNLHTVAVIPLATNWNHWSSTAVASDTLTGNFSYDTRGLSRDTFSFQLKPGTYDTSSRNILHSSVLIRFYDETNIFDSVVSVDFIVLNSNTNTELGRQTLSFQNTITGNTPITPLGGSAPYLINNATGIYLARVSYSFLLFYPINIIPAYSGHLCDLKIRVTLKSQAIGEASIYKSFNVQ